MRGLLTLLTNETTLHRYRTGIFLASAAPDIFKAVLPVVRETFREITFTYIAPQEYANLASLSSSGSEIMSLESIKASPLHALMGLRRRRVDVVVLMVTGAPTFRKPKLAALGLNPRRFILCNENAEFLIVDRRRWRNLWGFAVQRTRKYYLSSFLFFPFGLLYLVGRTIWLVSRARRRRSLPA